MTHRDYLLPHIPSKITANGEPMKITRIDIVKDKLYLEATIDIKETVDKFVFEQFDENGELIATRRETKLLFYKGDTLNLEWHFYLDYSGTNKRKWYNFLLP